MGDVVEIRPYEGKLVKAGQTIAEFNLKSDVLLDEVRAGGRINLIIGRGLTGKAREFLGLPTSTVFRLPTSPKTAARDSHWHRRWSAEPAGCPRVTACGLAPTVSPR